MNKVLIGFNVVLAAAVAYLFFKSPSEPTKKEGEKQAQETPFKGKKSKGELRIATVDLDSITNSYQLFKDQKVKMDQLGNQFMEELADMENKLIGASKKYEKDYNILTLSERQQREMYLQKMQNDYMILKEQRMGFMDSVRNSLNERAMIKLEGFIVDYSKKNEIDFVFPRLAAAKTLLYAEKSYDITGVCIAFLNEEYKKGNQ